MATKRLHSKSDVDQILENLNDLRGVDRVLEYLLTGQDPENTAHAELTATDLPPATPEPTDLPPATPEPPDLISEREIREAVAAEIKAQGKGKKFNQRGLARTLKAKHPGDPANLDAIRRRVIRAATEA